MNENNHLPFSSKEDTSHLTNVNEGITHNKNIYIKITVYGNIYHMHVLY